MSNKHKSVVSKSKKVQRKASGGRPRKADAVDRNERIFAIATKLFIEKGYSDTTLEAIARDAGVAKRTLYSLYSDKAALFSAVVQARVNRVAFPRMSDVSETESPHTVLHKLAKRLRDIIVDPNTVSLLRLMVGEAQRFPEFIATLAKDGNNTLYASIDNVLDDLVDKGLLKVRDRNCTTWAWRFCDFTIGMSSLHVIQGWSATIPSDEELSIRVSMFLELYG